jgi:hypothetical protein
MQLQAFQTDPGLEANTYRRSPKLDDFFLPTDSCEDQIGEGEEVKKRKEKVADASANGSRKDEPAPDGLPDDDIDPADFIDPEEFHTSRRDYRSFGP